MSFQGQVPEIPKPAYVWNVQKWLIMKIKALLPFHAYICSVFSWENNHDVRREQDSNIIEWTRKKFLGNLVWLLQAWKIKMQNWASSFSTHSLFFSTSFLYRNNMIMLCPVGDPFSYGLSDFIWRKKLLKNTVKPFLGRFFF